MRTKLILPVVLSISLPLMLYMLINSFYNIVDRHAGEQILTAVCLVYSLQTLIISINVGFGVGINVAVAFFSEF